MSKFSDPLNSAAASLREGNRDAAWNSLYPLMRYPSGATMTDAEFAQSLGMIEMIGKGSFTPPVEAALITARTSPNDAQAMFGAGFRLNEAGLPAIAASALARANTLAPNIPTLVNEYATALQQAGLYNEAFVVLHASREARDQDWQTRQLYVLNALMSGNVVAAQRGFSEIGTPPNEDAAEQHARLSRFLGRQTKIAPVTALDSRDLRGWHHVVTGGILTHVSPLGANDGMNGRYATMHDSDALIHEGVLRTIAVLQAWGIRPPQLIYSDDRSSEILSHVWNARLGIPTKVFRPDDVSSTGLFLAYDLQEADDDFLEAMAEYRPGQILASHASCWTQQSAYTSDICTYQYQSNVSLWESDAGTIAPPSQLGGHGDADVVERTAVAERILAYLAEPNEVAQRISTTPVPSEAVADLNELGALARAAGPPPESGRRDRFFVGSPVKSSRAS